MLPSKRDKQIGFEHQIVQHYDAEQDETEIKLECVPEDEQEHDIFASIDEAVLTNLKVCGASADGGSVSQSRHTNERPGIEAMPSVVELQNGSSLEESSLMGMFRSISEQIASIHNKIDSVQKEVANSSDRLRRLERKIGISLTTVEHAKDDTELLDKASGDKRSEDMQDNASCSEFKKISNEEEFIEFESQLGTDAEYYAFVKNLFSMKISYVEPNSRMHEAIDMMFDRSFMALCSWTGRSLTGPRIAFRIRKNILKLFADISSTRFMAVNELYVANIFKTKLRHAKYRLNLKGSVKSVCRKRKMPTEYIFIPAEKHAK
uniref:DUF4806 domain-containing protein n=1 Tax=Anopheles funestus TaxID=62324 RepID=A0A182S300_ANOFN